MRTKKGPECNVDGCHTEVLARGYCGLHYKKWYEYGDPTASADTRVKVEEVPPHLKHYLQRRRARIATAVRKAAQEGTRE